MLFTAQLSLERGLRLLSEAADGSERSLTPEAEADDSLEAHILQNAIFARSYRRLAHVLLAQSMPRVGMPIDIVADGKPMGLVQCTVNAVHANTTVDVLVPMSSTSSKLLTGLSLEEIEEVGGQRFGTSPMRLERLIEAAMHFGKADTLVDDVADGAEHDRTALAKILEMLAAAQSLTSLQAEQTMDAVWGAWGALVPDLPHPLETVASTDISRANLLALAKGIRQHDPHETIARASKMEETEPFQAGQLVVLRGARARGCLQPSAVGRLEYVLPREFKPLRVLCATGATSLFQHDDLRRAPDDATFTVPTPTKIEVGMLVVSTGISATTCIEQPVHPLYRFARVLQDDRSDVPYKLECPNGLQVWSKASFVKPAPEGAVFTRIPRPQLGDLVVRAAGSSRDACLATPTTVGKVIVDDRSSMPFKVQCPKAGVSTYWYRAEQVQLAPAGAAYEAPSASSVLPDNLFAEGPNPDAGGMFITCILGLLILCCCCCCCSSS